VAGKVLPSSATRPCPRGHWLLPMPRAFPCWCFPGQSPARLKALFNGKVFGGSSLGVSTGPAQPAAKGQLKPLSHEQGALGTCCTQGCSQPPAEMLSDGRGVLNSSAYPMGAPSTHQTAAGTVAESLCSIFQLFPSAGEAFLQV